MSLAVWWLFLAAAAVAGGGAPAGSRARKSRAAPKTSGDADDLCKLSVLRRLQACQPLWVASCRRAAPRRRSLPHV